MKGWDSNSSGVGLKKNDIIIITETLCVCLCVCTRWNQTSERGEERDRLPEITSNQMASAVYKYIRNGSILKYTCIHHYTCTRVSSETVLTSPSN